MLELIIGAVIALVSVILGAAIHAVAKVEDD